jgi:hypothetical protein
MLELSCICQDDYCVVLVISHFTIKVNFFYWVRLASPPSFNCAQLILNRYSFPSYSRRRRYQRPLILEGTNVMCGLTMVRCVLIYNFPMDLYSEECNWPCPPATHEEV